MPITYPVNMLRGVVGKFSGVTIPAATATQVSGSISVNGVLSNAALSALSGAGTAVPTTGIPSYFAQLIQLADPTAIIYVGRDNTVTNTSYLETLAPGGEPLNYQANGSLPLWIYCIPGCTMNVFFSQ